MSLRRSLSEESAVITAVAIDRDKNSQIAVKWAVENVLNKNPNFILIHVRSQSLHPKDCEAVSKEGRPPTEAELQQFFLPYRGFCARKGIKAREVVLHDIDVPNALIDYINGNSINNIVVGASNRNAVTRKFRNADLPTSLLKSAPEFCSIYVVSKGKVQTARPANQPQTPSSAAAPPSSKSSISVQASEPGFAPSLPPDMPDYEDMNRVSFSHGSWRSVGSDRSSDSYQASPQIKLNSSSWITSPTLSMASHNSGDYFQKNSASDASDLSGPRSFQTTDMSYENLESSMASESPRNWNSSHTPRNLEAEMRRLKLELKQSTEMYNSACQEAITAKQRARELYASKNEEKRKLEEAKAAEEAALALAQLEKQRTKAAMEAALMARRLAEIETRKRKDAETKAKCEAEEKRTTAKNSVWYRKYTIEEIEVATDYFTSSLKIGEGGYGPVFKSVLDHTPVAIKVLRPDASQGLRQFQQEVEVLSCMRHPNMVLLLGACPQYGCLVYEYMENGSLEDRLFRKDDTPPLSWRTRFKIAAEISTALLFLHQAKPEPLVHRDLKPANILLDRNYVGKVSDVGLARLLPASVADSVTEYCMTAAAGTFCYIDPEYQQTGMLSVKSDIYSLGVLLLQIITARHPVGLSHQIEEAIENGRFDEMLDSSVPDWPVEEALSFAKLALQCCELRRKDRPDLGSVVLPELNRLRQLAMDNGTSDIEIIMPSRQPYTSAPQIEALGNQINVRTKRRLLKSVTRMWSMKTAAPLMSGFPPIRKQVEKPMKKHTEACWSFVSCSVPHPKLKKFSSFS